eukprot:1158577-Pelagomonas_calceolata.AAC.3
MGMKLASKLNGTLMVKSKLFELLKGVFNIIGLANIQKDRMKRVGLELAGQALPDSRVVGPMVEANLL